MTSSNESNQAKRDGSNIRDNGKKSEPDVVSSPIDIIKNADVEKGILS